MSSRRAATFLIQQHLVRRKCYARHHSTNAATNLQPPTPTHQGVMLDELLHYLDQHVDFQQQQQSRILDLTFGGGTHTQAILERWPLARVHALDRDPAAIAIANDLRDDIFGDRLTPLLGRFSEVLKLLDDDDSTFDAILLDAGTSTPQFEVAERGFSLRRDGPLDMRMGDGNSEPDSVTAAEVIAYASESELSDLFKSYGEERLHRRIAQAIVEHRTTRARLSTTRQLADLIAIVTTGFSSDSIPNASSSRDKLGRFQHPATRVFQALRIFVNDELNELDYALNVSHALLRQGGLFIGLSFHSLEDRLMKEHLTSADANDRLLEIGGEQREGQRSVPISVRSFSRTFSKEDVAELLLRRWRLVERKVVTPKDEEVKANPRARSAKMRVAVKV